MPKLVEGLESEIIVAISCGTDHMAAINGIPYVLLFFQEDGTDSLLKTKELSLHGVVEEMDAWALGRSETTKNLLWFQD